ncbi:ASCH domain-containing protein [Pseudonocardia hydrocarbonoxydans]|uniref:ASCH domain-containing protein n=1 Tax=Pseudonocardia hydrocarbonoxydans TaxID=76726 RepID=A0A4Y3WQ50_9PSEU|nr:ASCH domain-containing protein [Pseudonocardia hydrocarbonoxydans]GEC19506.1 hypothetical protein PHY01_17890 [Pseudonocardia hydrocarbonoxydans]
MLIRRPVLDAIAAGTVTCAFRRWSAPRVRPGTMLRTAVGVLEIVSVEPVAASRLTAADARSAGYATLAALRAENARREGTLYRVTLRPAGPDPRIALRESADLSADDRAALTARLARMDRRTPWTAAVLALIAEHPGVRAPDLAARLGRETAPFKRDVRKLKELGLTESLEVGYRLSPRGRAYLHPPG